MPLSSLGPGGAPDGAGTADWAGVVELLSPPGAGRGPGGAGGVMPLSSLGPGGAC